MDPIYSIRHGAPKNRGSGETASPDCTRDCFLSESACVLKYLWEARLMGARAWGLRVVTTREALNELSTSRTGEMAAHYSTTDSRDWVTGRRTLNALSLYCTYTAPTLRAGLSRLLLSAPTLLKKGHNYSQQKNIIMDNHSSILLPLPFFSTTSIKGTFIQST